MQRTFPRSLGRAALVRPVLAAALALCAASAGAQGSGGAAAAAAGASSLQAQIDTRAKAVEARLIAWRRDIHQHP
ncbi:amidohydrolase, partial [Variovorax sp. KBW07]